MNWRRIGIGILIVALLSAGGFWAYTQFLAPEDAAEETPSPDVDTISVDTGLGQVSAEGQIVPLTHAQLSFQLSGELAELLVTEGDAVTRGAPLLRLDTTDQMIAVMQAEAAVAQATANVTAAEAGLLAAQVGVEAAQVGVQAAEAQLALVQAGPTEAQIALGEQQVAAAEAGVVQAAGSRDVTLESTTAADLAAAEAQLAAAQAAYDAALRSFQPVAQNEDADEDAREQAQLQLAAAQANLEAAQASLAEAQAGPNSGERTAAVAQVQVAANRQEAAQANLNLLLAGPREEQIGVAEAGVTQAEAAVTEAELRVAQAETAVSQAQAALAEAEGNLAAAQELLAKRTLTAPFDGTVAAIDVKEGQVVTAGAPVLTIADFSGWQIETTDLTEQSVVNVARGYTAEITVDAFPGETLTGTVTEIAAVSDLVRGDVTYKVTLDLPDDNGLPLRWGMTTFVMLETDQ